MMQFRTKHIFFMTTLFALFLAFVLPILLRAPQTAHQQLCEDLRIGEPEKTQTIAHSVFEDSTGAYHTYFLLESETDGRYVLRHAFHTPRKLWLQNWFPLNTDTLKALGYNDILLDEMRTFTSKPVQADIDSFLDSVKPVLKSQQISFAK
jgi:hypothetical protein